MCALVHVLASLASQPYFSAYVHARAKVGTRACAYVEKYGWLARLCADQLLSVQTDEVRSLGVREMMSGQLLPQNVHSMNAYLG